ncbi:MAG TPA: asparagine synthetase B, partial [Stellaceae bacterium]|nr:asparagine synthetase B [Stellaceae bacterium]
MCGIWFSVGFSPDPARIDIVAHRGPDGRGWAVFDSPLGPLALGHRRLSIIDLSDAAAQPMSYGEGRYH